MRRRVTDVKNLVWTLGNMFGEQQIGIIINIDNLLDNQIFEILLNAVDCLDSLFGSFVFLNGWLKVDMNFFF